MEGDKYGLLLYKGGTVCDDRFDDTAADAICRQLNFTRAESWTIELKFDVQRDYDIKMDDIDCRSVDWIDCSFSKRSDCGHNEDVFLKCTGDLIL